MPTQDQNNRGLAPQGLASYLSPTGLGFLAAGFAVWLYAQREQKKGAELAPGRVIDIKQLSGVSAGSIVRSTALFESQNPSSLELVPITEFILK